MAYDFKREFRDLYQPKAHPSLVDVPAMTFVAVAGTGDPNEEGGAYARAMELLYAFSYAVKMSKKLLMFVLDDGTGTDRVILSGIHDYYEPEELIGKTCVAIVNLPPRPMMGIDSCGMLISAVHKENGEEGLNLLMLDDKIPAGAKLY